MAEIVQIGRLQTGQQVAVVRATGRARIGAGVNGPGAALWVEAEPIVEPEADESVKELATEYRQLLISILQHRNAWQVIDAVQRMTGASELADSAGYAAWLDAADKKHLLETTDVAERLQFLSGKARDQLAELDVSERIREDVREGMEKNQREFLLRQQLAAIRKELGEGEPEGSDDYRARVEAATLPDDVRKSALREVDKLERSSEQNPEAGWIRTWLDTVLDIPWAVRTEDNTDVAGAREVLDADHTGLDDVKDRITEYLAVPAPPAAPGPGRGGGRRGGARPAG